MRRRATWREAKKRPSSLAHIAATHINLSEGRYEAAITEAARAIALDPNDPEAHVAMAWAMIATGRPQAALGFIRTAMRLNPSYPSHYALARGMALFATGALDETARVLRSRDGAQPRRHRAGTAAGGDLRAARAQAGGA